MRRRKFNSLTLGNIIRELERDAENVSGDLDYTDEGGSFTDYHYSITVEGSLLSTDEIEYLIDSFSVESFDVNDYGDGEYYIDVVIQEY